MLTILPLTRDNQAQLHQVDARFLAGDRVQLRCARRGFLADYEPLQVAQWRTVPPCRDTAEQLLDNPDAVCYFAMFDHRLSGQCIARRAEHSLCELTDLRVESHARRNGVASALLDACVDWARSKGCAGLSAATTDEQTAACQFFSHKGFVLGGVDLLRLHADPAQTHRLPTMRESILLFYKFF